MSIAARVTHASVKLLGSPGGVIRRWGLWTGDLSKRAPQDQVLRSILRDAQAGKIVTLWGSLSCDPWCAWHRIFRSSQDYSARLESRRAVSRKMLTGFLRICSAVLAKVPKERIRIAFEWPRGCDGWSEPLVRKLRRILRHTCDFDGCRYGVKDR